ncbi:hypothetical protein FRUB_06035 [Fimbriiglobus ruber]|uniref:Uncharacterized protein n=1 Tax=Fimbriiglobus ruber TaxID=1908690 RepID=A0A225DDC4_9BACT|nr:hypothetical protein FRUB_06035 [Fimbriiglobus ruber]
MPSVLLEQYDMSRIQLLHDEMNTANHPANQNRTTGRNAEIEIQPIGKQ